MECELSMAPPPRPNRRAIPSPRSLPTLQRARETLQQCGDILAAHGLSDEEPDHRQTSAWISQQDQLAGPIDDSGLEGPKTTEPAQGCCTTSMLDGTKRIDGVDGSRPVTEGRGGGKSPLTLSFRGLGNFDDKVLFACLVEDEQAARLRRLALALHSRFSEAELFHAAATGKGRQDQSDSGFEFTPHLTVMKTSKLKNRGVLIPSGSYDRHRDLAFGSHTPLAVELSSMLEREEASSPGDWETQLYYKCHEKLNLRSPLA